MFDGENARQCKSAVREEKVVTEKVANNESVDTIKSVTYEQSLPHSGNNVVVNQDRNRGIETVPAGNLVSPSVIEVEGKRFACVGREMCAVLNADVQLGDVSSDMKDLSVPSYGKSTSRPKFSFIWRTPTSITFGCCFNIYVSIPKGMVVPERVALFVPSVK